MRHAKVDQALQLARLLASSAEGETIDGMASALGVSRRTAERLRDAVERSFGALTEEADGRMKRFRLQTPGLGNFLTQPSAEEIAELVAAARRHELQGDAHRAALLTSLGAKIGAAMRESARRKAAPDIEGLLAAEAFVRSVGPQIQHDAGVARTLRQALLARRQVRIDYQSATDAEPRTRTLIPYGLLVGPRTQLIAAPPGEVEPRSYRLDRITHVDMLEDVGQPPDGFDLEAFARRSFGTFHEPPAEVVLRFTPRAAPEAARFLFHPAQTCETGPDGSLLVRFTAGGLRQIAHHLLTWSGEVEALEPSELRAEVAREALLALERHQMTGFLQQPAVA